MKRTERSESVRELQRNLCIAVCGTSAILVQMLAFRIVEGLRHVPVHKLLDIFLRFL